MKQYVIDQLRESDYSHIKDFLSKHAEPSPMDGIYWVDMPEDLYSKVQRDHKGCQPFYFAVNLHYTYVGFEFLVRSRNVIRCSCIAYATPEQRNFIINYGDDMIEKLSIKI